MRRQMMVFGVIGGLIGVCAWGGQITSYIDERGRRVYVNADEPPKKAAAPKPKPSSRSSVLVRRDPRTKKLITVPAPPDPAETQAAPAEAAPQTAPAMRDQGTASAQEPAGAQKQQPAEEPQGRASVVPTNVDEIISDTAERHAVDPDLVRAIVKVESNFNPAAISRKGAMGLMQLVPQTARRFGVSNIFDPGENVDGGVRYLKHLLSLYNGNLRLSLAAYNAGEKAVDRHNGVPPYPETRQYVHRISSLYRSGYIVNSFGLSNPSSSTRPGQAQPDRWGIMKHRDEKGVIHFSNTEGW